MTDQSAARAWRSSHVAITAWVAIAMLLTGLTSRADEADDHVNAMIAGMHGAFGQFGELVGGLSPEQQTKADALEKAIAAKLRADPAQANRGMAFKLEVMAQFRTILTAPQQQKFDAALNESRQRMAALVSANHLKQIGLACIMYANDHQQALPHELGDLVASLDASAFLAGTSTVEPPKDFAKLDAATRKKWANEHAEFVYLGAGKKLDAVPADFVVAYVKAGAAAAPNAFLLSDGSVQMLDAEKSGKVIAELTAGKNPSPALVQK